MPMTPRERLLAALRREAVDWVPCVPHFWSSPEVDGYRWQNEAERLEVLIHKLGVDAIGRFGVATRQHPDVQAKVWEERPAGERYPLLHKAITTPKGALSAVVRRTEDWPHGRDIPFFSDFNVSRYVKPWLESPEDVEKFAYVYLPPEAEQVRQAQVRWAGQRPLWDRFQVPVLATYTAGLTGALQLFGAQTGVLLSMDRPAAFERYVEITHHADSRVLEILLDLGVDVVRRNGWYESTDFWNPAQFRRWVLPAMQQEIAMAHAAGRAFTYTMCTGLMPLLPRLAELPFDSLDTIEPALGGQDMVAIKETLGATKSLWGGVSAPMHIGEGTPEEVRAAVRRALNVFGRRGFLLTAVPSIRPHWPWANVLAMLDEWRRLR